MSEHALIPWAVPGYNSMEWVSCVVGESVMLADTPVSAHSSQLMPTPGTGVDLSERFGGCSMIFLLTFAVLQTVVYSDLGCSSIACLAIGLAVLEWTSTSCLELALQMGTEA